MQLRNDKMENPPRIMNNNNTLNQNNSHNDNTLNENDQYINMPHENDQINPGELSS